MDRHLDLAAKAGEMLVDGIIHHLENAVVQSAFIRRPDVHARALPDAREPFELVDLGGIVLAVRVQVRDDFGG